MIRKVFFQPHKGQMLHKKEGELFFVFSFTSKPLNICFMLGF